MLGPLPTLHRIVVTLVVVSAAATLGLWAGAAPAVPVVPSVATAASVAFGALLAWLLVRASAGSVLDRDER